MEAPMLPHISLISRALGLAVGLAAVLPARAEAPLTIAELVRDGWSVAGYAAQGNTYILFRKDGADHLVQCSVLYDTTRGATQAERVKTNCYELR
jgi:hypothetical protein